MLPSHMASKLLIKILWIANSSTMMRKMITTTYNGHENFNLILLSLERHRANVTCEPTISFVFVFVLRDFIHRL